VKLTPAFVLFALLTVSCNSSKKDTEKKNNRISLRTDTLNVVKMTDTMIIYENPCRGCAYENSTNFSISESLGIVELDHIETHDNNSPEMDGGNISKNLIIVPKRTGSTIIKMYKFWEQPVTAEDSARYTTYAIEVKN
jgi:hypothetical protein